MRPRKRSRPRRSPRSTLTRRVTVAVAPTTTIGLTTSGRAGICTRNWVFTGTDAIVCEKLPSEFVTSVLPTGRKPCVYGHGLLLTTTSRPALPVPDSTPDKVVTPPAITGLGLAASDTPSGWRLVRNVRRAPSVIPCAF